MLLKPEWLRRLALVATVLAASLLAYNRPNLFSALLRIFASGLGPKTAELLAHSLFIFAFYLLFLVFFGLYGKNWAMGYWPWVILGLFLLGLWATFLLAKLAQMDLLRFLALALAQKVASPLLLLLAPLIHLLASKPKEKQAPATNSKHNQQNP